MQDILFDSIARFSRRREIKTAAYFLNKNHAFPVIGSRERRGPDVTFEYQDNFGPGTAVAHSAYGLTYFCRMSSNGQRNI
ncbi:hypothetical protein DPMN_108908 [Dreissena polymorpha]|uniref:Uncharacterized protein n=1 Tax=Dreissena polymorpha TaxID=45954 RepID=A0A9D4K9Q0_DREPO|nr:hypothetical protein DPMN_108908 [Dreissena polymorpha]